MIERIVIQLISFQSNTLGSKPIARILQWWFISSWCLGGGSKRIVNTIYCDHHNLCQMSHTGICHSALTACANVCIHFNSDCTCQNELLHNNFPICNSVLEPNQWRQHRVKWLPIYHVQLSLLNSTHYNLYEVFCISSSRPCPQLLGTISTPRTPFAIASESVSPQLDSLYPPIIALQCGRVKPNPILWNIIINIIILMYKSVSWRAEGETN